MIRARQTKAPTAWEGWHAYGSDIISGSSETISANYGQTNAKGLMSWGDKEDGKVATPAVLNDRAFGILSSGNPDAQTIMAVEMVNNNTMDIEALAVEFYGEQWRVGAGANDTLKFEYSLDATAGDNGTWTEVTELTFAAPDTTSAAGEVDGNDSDHRTLKQHTITFSPGDIS